MSLVALLAVYLTAAFSLVGGVVAALVALTGPVGSEPAKPPLPKVASADSVRQIIVEPRQQAFRYGPEVNHGRSDTPVHAREQALREARAMAPAKVRRPGADQQQLMPESRTMFGIAPSVQSSGH
jgi:hypothetical protein